MGPILSGLRILANACETVRVPLDHRSSIPILTALRAPPLPMLPSPASTLALAASDEGWDLVERPLLPLADVAAFPSGLVRVKVSCASVSHAQAQVMSCQRLLAPGRVLGHEAVGRVLEISPLARRWLDEQGKSMEPGDRLVVFPFLPCLGVDASGGAVECPACGLGRVEECPRLRALGVDEDGLLIGHRDLPPQVLHRVPDQIADTASGWIDLLYVEAISQALVAAQTPALAAARHIAVVGRGPVQELTARVIEAVHFGWGFSFHDAPTPTPPAAVIASDSSSWDAPDGTPGMKESQEEAAISAARVHRLDPSALPRHPRAFDVIVETWADPASLSDMFQALRSNGALVRKSRPGRAVSLLRQASPIMPVRIVEAPYGSFSSALSWMASHPGALRDLDQDAHRHALSARSNDSLSRVPLRSGSPFADGMGFPFSKGGILAALDADRRRDQIGKIYLEIDAPPTA